MRQNGRRAGMRREIAGAKILDPSGVEGQPSGGRCCWFMRGRHEMAFKLWPYR
jgi:hypothetical protein